MSSCARSARSARFLLFLVASLLSAFVYFQQQGALPLHVVDQGLSFATFGALISLNGSLSCSWNCR